MTRNVSIDTLAVHLGSERVGTLAETPDGLVAFEYDAGWLGSGFSVNPYSLPLEDRVFVPDWQPFDGLFGVFHDSLPDGWGALLLDRMLAAEGLDPSAVGPLQRLAIVGSSGRGALRYEPELGFAGPALPADIDELACLCQDIFEDVRVEDLDVAYEAGGSSGGARPKAYVRGSDGVEWLVKFPSRIDPPDIGEAELAFLECARECGIDVPEARLLPSALCSGYFATRRFDVEGGARVHMVSASGMLEVSHRVPSLDYRSLLQLSFFLNGSSEQATQLFRLMCFNVFAHNHDDHSNNFSWLCRNGHWELAPAYDLTYSRSFGYGHTTTVNGSGRPTLDDIHAIAAEAGIRPTAERRIVSDIRERCTELLEARGLPLPDVPTH